MKQKIEIDIDIPDGYEFVRYGIPNQDEYELFFLRGSVVFKIGFKTNNEIFIIRKIKQWREPVLPADFGKEARFSCDGEEWLNFRLVGWNDGYFCCGGGGLFKFCQVCDEEKS